MAQSHSKHLGLPRLYGGMLVFALLGAFVLYGLTGLSAPGQTAWAAGTITGTVFQDFNGDGVFNTTAATGVSRDLHLAGVTVTAYDSSGTQRGQTTTVRCTGSGAPQSYCTGADTGPNYSLAASGTGPYRIEFTWTNTSGALLSFEPSSHSTDSVEGGSTTNSGSTVQFVANGNTSNVNLALNRTCDYCQNNAKLVTTRFENGLRTSNTNASVVSMAYDPSSHTNDANIASTGAVWGVAYDGLQKRVYTSAFLKRHVDLGPRGMDGVYVMDYSGATPTLLGGFDLQGVTASNGGTIDLGSVTRGTTADNTLGTATNANIDLDAFAKVGKTGFGDIDFGADNKSLWMVNLYQRTLVKVDTSRVSVGSSNPNTITTAAVNHYNIVSGGPSTVTLSGAPSCTSGNLRPFGLKIRETRGYLGVVCDAASSSTLDNPPELIGYVLSFSTSNPTSFTNELSIPFTYNREPYYQMKDGTNRVDGQWQRWMDTWSDAQLNTPATPACCADFRSAPAPILSDIEFMPDGSLILGVMDRFSHQSGWENRKALSGDNTTLDYGSVGDVLYAKYSAGSYTLESGESDPGDPSGNSYVGYRTDDSPGNHGEYFYGDAFTGSDATHGETTLGALAYMPGGDRVFSPAYDPTAFFTQGLIWQPTTPGDQIGAYAVSTSTGIRAFGKANGMGDIELLCDAAPIEIGNRVWSDDNGNGIQDPGEGVFAGVTVQLWADTDGDGTVDTQVGTAVTDSNGEYYFGGLNNTNMLASGSSSTTFSTRVAAGADDAEQSVSTGTSSTTSSVLNIPQNSGSSQLQGIRFQNITVPAGATITNATIQFTSTSSTSANTVNVLIKGQASDDAPAFASTSNNISSRATTTASVAWSSIGSWTANSTNNATTPSLATIVQEIVNRSGWSSGNDIAFILSNNSSTNSAERDAYSYDGSSSAAPYLTIEYSVSSPYTVLPATAYQVRIDPTAGSNASLLNSLALTTQNAAQPANGGAAATNNNSISDVGDSDAAASGNNYVINLTTGNAGQNNLSLDFGFNPWFSVGNRIWYDTDNSGTINGSEVGINGISVSLVAQGTILYNGATYTAGQVISTQTTAGGGYYRFDNLTPGSYSVRVNASNFTSGSGTLAGYNSSGTTVNANSNTTDQRDTGVDDTAAPTNGISTNTFTLAYSSAPAGNAPTGETDGVNSPSTLNTADSRANLTVDFGFYRLTVGNTVFRDDGSGGGTFNNGIQDGSEPGISGVTVRLFRDADNDGVIDSGELVAVTTTDANGNYLFNQQTDANGNGNGVGLVPASNYKVQITSGQSALAGFESSADSANSATPMNADNDDNGVGTGSANSTNVTTNAFTLGAGVSGNTTNDATGTTNNPRLDLGFVPGYSIGNRVWYDTNNSGSLNGSEVGISGVTVALVAQSSVTVGGTTYTAGQTIATTTTNASGYYRFDGLPAGTYSISLPASNWTSGGTPLAGYQGSTGQTAQNNNNPNTTSDSSDNGNNPSDVTASGIASTNIILGTSNPAPTGETDGVNSPSTAATIDARANLTVDFGLYRLTVGNTVFRDDGSGGGTANNGVQDGSEAGISGVTVQLLDGSNNVIAVTTTDANGNYVFTQQTNGAGTGNGKPIPPANNYTIRIPSGQTVLAGYQSSADGANAATPMGTDSDDNGIGTANANTNNTNTSAFTVSNGGSGNPTAPAGNTATDATGTVNNPRVDFGMVPLFSIGNRVWRDMGGGAGGVANDGLMNGTEAGISGVTVSLYQDSNSDGVADGAAVATTTTDANGYYNFSSLTQGKYIVTIDAANFGSGKPLVGYYSSSGLKTGDAADRGVDRSAAGQIVAGVSSQTITLGPTDNAPTGSAETDFTTGQTQSGTQNGTADGRANLQIDFGFQNSTPTSTDMGQVTAQVTDGPAVDLQWTSLSEINIVGFNVLRSATKKDGYAPLNESPILPLSLGEMKGNVYQFADSGVAGGATYYYRIEYLRPDGSGSGTEPVRVKIPVAQCALGVPTLTGPQNAQKVKAGKVTFTWEPTGCAVTYKFQVRDGSPAGAVVVNKKALTATQLTVKKLKAGGTYAWRVLACGADGKCVASDWWTLQLRQAKAKK